LLRRLMGGGCGPRKLEAFEAGRRAHARQPGCAALAAARSPCHRCAPPPAGAYAGMRCQQRPRLVVARRPVQSAALRPRLGSGPRCPSSAGAIPPLALAAPAAAPASAPCARRKRFCLSDYPAGLFVRVPERNTSRACSRCLQLRPRQAGFRAGGSQPYKLQACKRHDPELVFDGDVSASIAGMAVLLGLLFAGHVPPWPDDAWCRRRPAGHHRGGQASTPSAPP
jgi:hypothetical protein